MLINIYMNTKKMKRVSLINLIAGYIVAMLFILLMMINRDTTIKPMIVEHNNTQATQPTQTFTELLEPTKYRDAQTVVYTDHDVVNRSAYDRGNQFVDSIDYHDSVVRNDAVNHGSRMHHDTYRDVYDNRTHRVKHNTKANVGRRDDSYHEADPEYDLLDRRLREEEEVTDLIDRVKNSKMDDINLDAGNLVVDDGDDLELGESHDFQHKNSGGGNNPGGELYAYNFPGQGVGAGVGNPGVGAAGGYAGIGAGIGQAVYQGAAVAALGGVGTADSGSSGEVIPGAGVGGLVNGAGSGAAAGLLTGRVMAALGVGEPGAGGNGGYNFDHLPQDGALHIMLHVDGSGSILDTRKQLEIMRDTLLKDRLLPYYNNDESLYDRRVTIVDSSGERSLKFFAQATREENVLAIAFQDEAQPVYHLPNFNKRPESLYLSDLNKLKESLDQHYGVYRGILIQVDRGKTFAKSFKEFVENSFQGKGYLTDDNLKNYHRDDNIDNIRNSTGVVFSDEYHVSDTGTPDYYMDLLMTASARVGLDLNSHGGGLTDGTHVID